MTFAIPDIAVFFTAVGMAFYFSEKAVEFPLSVPAGRKVPPGRIWGHLRAIIYPIFAGTAWEVVAAFLVASGNDGNGLLFYFCEMLMLVFYVVALVMIFYLAFNPIVEVLEGRDRLEE